MLPYIFMILGVLSALAIMLLTGMYTAWYHILIFLALSLGCFVMWVILFLLFVFICSIFVDKRKERTNINRFYYRLVAMSARLGIFFTNTTLHFEGGEKLPKDERFLMVGNHLSNLDPMSVLTKIPDKDILFVSKPENFDIPVVGRAIQKSGFMAIDRENVRNAIVTINKAADYIKNDKASVFIFPEGTRNRTAKGLLEFKNGAFKIATKAKCPIVIAAFSHTELVMKSGPWKHKDIYLKIVDVIPAERVATMRTQEISDEVYEKILANTLNR